ncbi:diacylglycerol/lipid kinase family protein [Paenactinomyces guangxiensis]|uniref:Diacylglycerol kinase family lipid kinase n=1 Tax=Paenactinomyces guangxiensis TaxID=1490290 RepID=A0A7W2A8U7_9BACL|nr:diacylglycerol kinase family protein [Paenactinomyces guangxiensis]MBA4494975.1 diacylglycerol kinase family lipid kinase [Paenactinomyces guangxiensis]MBH8592058.1 diacylglycerol kinase family lipid kinase [Paenactinomyces guangxiensis]
MRIFIVNRVSGNGRGRKVWAEVQRILDGRQIPYRVKFTERRGHATEIARCAARADVEAVVAVGGDGTLHEVGNGLVGTETPMGYIPAGSGNDFALAQSIPSDPNQALERILKHRIHRVDTADIDGRVMIGFSGIGFDAKVAETVNRSPLKRWLGKSIYFFGAIQVLAGFRPTRVSLQVDGQCYKYEGVWLIAVTNTPYYGGGMNICPQAVNDDGFLDVCCVKEVTHMQFLSVLPAVYHGGHVNHPGVRMHRGKRITIQSDTPLVAHADGENLGNTPLSIQIRPKSLSLL